MSGENGGKAGLLERLRECTERLDHMPDWVWETDAQGRFTYSNAASLRLAGMPPSEVVGTTVMDLVIPEERTRTLGILRDAIQRKAPLEHVLFQLQARGGAIHAMDVSGSPVLDSRGELIGFRGIARDVTALLESQRAALEAMKNYRHLVEDSPTGIVVLQDDRIAYANPQLLQLMGYTAEESVGIDASTFIHPDDRKNVREHVARRLDGEPVEERYEVRLVTKSGEILHFWVQATVIDYNGRPAILDNLIDITERRRAERALVESEERFRALVERTSDWVWEVDRDAIYTYASPRIRELLGYEPGDVLGRSVFDLMPPEEAERVSGIFGPIAARHEPFALLENTLVAKDGRLVDVETSGEPIFDAGGEFVGYRGIDRDITERKAAEEMLRRRYEAVAAGIFVHGTEGVVTYVNDAACEIVGVPRDELLGCSCLYERFESIMEDGSPFDHADHPSAVALRTGQAVRNVVVGLPLAEPPGMRWLLSSAQPVFDPKTGELREVIGSVVDITDRKAAEEALKRSERFLQAVFDGIQDGISVSDRNLNVLRTNRAIEKMYEYTLPLCGRKCYEVYHGRKAPCEVCPSVRAMEGKSLQMDLLPWYSSTGEVAGWLEVYAFPLMDEDGEVWGVVEHVRDVTAKKRAEDEQRDSEARLRRQQSALAELAKSEAIGRGDQETAFRQMAEIGAKTLGVERANFWLFNEDRSKIACVEHYILSKDEHCREGEISVQGHLGYFRAIEAGPVIADDAVSYESTREFAEDYLKHHGITSMSDAPLRLGGVVAGIVCFEHTGPPRQWTSDEVIFVSSIADLASIALEASERRLAEKALRESEERYRSFVENFQGIAFRATPDFRSIFVHGLVERISGYTEAEFMGGSPLWTEVIHPDDLQGFLAILGELVSKPGSATDLQYRIIRKDGAVRWLHDFVRNMPDESGGTAYLQGALYDITEQKRDQERLLRLNECFLTFGPDPLDNINSLVALLGELLDASCALYNRLEVGLLVTCGQWHTPPGYMPVDRPEGHICYDIIRQGRPEAVLIRNLPETEYYRTDPNVARYNLRTYFGRVVRFADEIVGSLCAAFECDYVPTGSDERLIGVIASAIGVEEQRRQAEDALRASETLLRQFAEHTPAAVAMFDRDMRYLSFSKRWLSDYKLGDRDLTGLSHYEVFPDVPDRWKEAHQRALTGSVEHCEEDKFERADGSVEWIRWEVHPWRNEAREIGGIIMFTEVITERKKTELALQESMQMLKLVLDTIPAHVFWKDADGVYLGCNGMFAVDAGLASPDEIVGKTDFDLPWEREEAEKYRADDRTVIETGTPKLNYEETQFTAEDHITWVRTSKVPLRDVAGRVIGVLGTFEDITERKQAQDRLLLDESRLEGLLALSQMTGSSLQDITSFAMEEAVRLTSSKIGYVAFANEDESVLTMYSWSKSAMSECAIAEKPLIYPTETTGLWGEAVRQRKPVVTNDYVAPNPLKKGYPEGHVRVIRHMNVPIFDGERIVVVAGVGNKESDYDDSDVRQLTLLMDGMWKIIQQARAAEALRESEEKYRDLVETTDTGYLIVDTQGRVIDANAEYVRLTGRQSLDEIAGHSVLEWTAPYDLERNEQEVRKCAETGVVRNLNVDYVSPEGKITPIEINATVIDSETGPRILTLCRDVTERRRADEALKASEQSFRVLFEQSPDMVSVLANGHFTAMNSAITRMLGYSPEEAIGLTPWQISPEFQPDGQRSEEKVRQMVRFVSEVGRHTFEWVHRHKNGSLVECEVGLAAYEASGETRILAIVRDITERKRAEEHRREFERRVETQKRQFYRETIMSVTDGKLDICDIPDIRPYLASADLKFDLHEPSEVSQSRHAAQAFCRERGLDGERLEAFIVGVGEGLTNAIKHGRQGRVYAGQKDGSVWVGVADKGEGIESLILPRATLLRGFSTKPSLGLGYSIMLDVADRVLLKTDRRGTTVILIKSIEEPKITFSADMLPDTWGQQNP